MDYSVYYDKGKQRTNNEDNYIIDSNSNYSLVCVADGMGGHNAGEVASKIAVNSINNYNFDLDSNLTEEIKKIIIKSNQKILDKGANCPEYEGMGTTLSLGLIYQKKLFIGHVGDSRIYLYRNHTLQKLTSDHTLVNELVKKEKIDVNDVSNHPQKHVLTQALGIDDNLKVETKKCSLAKRDLLILCTDGLTDMINEDNIENTINNSEFDAEVITRKLGEKALKNGGRDNLTIIVLILN